MLFVHQHDHHVIAEMEDVDDDSEDEDFVPGDDEVCADFHRASEQFENWQPDTASGHVFKNMVTEMEQKHRRK